MEDSTFILPITQAVLAIAFSYLIGSIPMGLIVGQLSRGIDIREHGSGNIGLTNVIRTIGWGPGLATGVLDFFKGYLPVFIVLRIFSPDDFGGVATVYELIVIMVALFLILGNMFPVYLLFKGGKGIATGFGVLSALMGVYIFIPLAVFGLILFLFRFVSLASIAAVIAVPVTVMLFPDQMSLNGNESVPGASNAFALLLGFTSAVAILVLWRHKNNIMRIMQGTEPRVGRPKDPVLAEPKPLTDYSNVKPLTDAEQAEASSDANKEAGK